MLEDHADQLLPGEVAEHNRLKYYFPTIQELYKQYLKEAFPHAEEEMDQLGWANVLIDLFNAS